MSATGEELSEKEDYECAIAVRVVFGYCTDKGEDDTYVFYVPESLLWDADLLAYLYTACRASVMPSPGADGFDESAWDSWHLIECKKPDEDIHVVIGISANG